MDTSSLTSADHAVALARWGFHPIRLHRPVFTGDVITCTCGQPKCVGLMSSAGKHPVDNDWGKLLTRDEDRLRKTFSGDWNVGIVLGPAFSIPEEQAVIDIEDDSPEGRELADVLLGEFPGPAYSSGKSIHRLYRFTPGIHPKAKFEYGGLEFRFGGASLQTQSVAPPSLHQTGVNYQWLPGRSPDDLPLIELPPHVIEWIQERASDPAEASRSKMADRFRRPIGIIEHPNRHASLLTYANSLWRDASRIHGINGLEEQIVQQKVWMQLMGGNLLVCSPPKSDAEVAVIFNSSMAFMLGELEREADAKVQASGSEPPENNGRNEPASRPGSAKDLELGQWLWENGIRLTHDPRLDPMEESPDRIDEWVADEWSVALIAGSDDDLVDLKIKRIPEAIRMRQAEFLKPDVVSRRVLVESDGKVMLDRTFPMWSWKEIWSGRKNDRTGKRGVTRGLLEHLLAGATIVQATEHQSGLVDQVEDLILALAGCDRESIIDAVELATQQGMPIKDRLKIDQRSMGGLVVIRAPEDPLTGWYWSNDGLVLMVKLDEVTKRYRSAYGSGVQNRLIAEALGKIGLEREKIRSGPQEGRWFVKRKFE